MGIACDAARAYVELIQQGRYDELGGLWAEDAVFRAPNGRIYHGSREIGEFYSHFLGQITPTIRIGSLAEDEVQGVCTMELEARMAVGEDGVPRPSADGAFRRAAIDRFVVGQDGKVKEMIVYLPAPGNWSTE